MAEINKIIVGSEEYPIQLAEDQVFGYHEVADKIRKNAVAAKNLEKQLDAYNDIWYDDSLYGYETIDSYHIRPTANGQQVINESKARLKRVAGNTSIDTINQFDISQIWDPKDLSSKIYIARGKIIFTSKITDFYCIDKDGNPVTWQRLLPYCVAGDKVTFFCSSLTTATENPTFLYDGATPDEVFTFEREALNYGRGKTNTVTLTQEQLNSQAIFKTPEHGGNYEFTLPMAIKGELPLDWPIWEPFIRKCSNVVFNDFISTSKNSLYPMNKRTVIKDFNESLILTPNRILGVGPFNRFNWNGKYICGSCASSNYVTPENNDYFKISSNNNTIWWTPKSDNYGVAYDFHCKPGTVYTWSVERIQKTNGSPLSEADISFLGNRGTGSLRNATKWFACYYDKQGAYIRGADITINANNLNSKTGGLTVVFETPLGTEWALIGWCYTNSAPFKKPEEWSDDNWGGSYVNFAPELILSNIQIEEGNSATAYEPYKESVLDFPETELPLYATIDFDTKTITDYGVTIVCDTELISKANFARNGSGFILVNVLPKEEEPKRIGVSSIGYAVSGTGEPRVQVAYTGGQKNILFIGLPFWKGMDDSDNQDFKDWLQELADAGTPLTIRYLSTVATTESFDEENEYTVWKDGTEQILGDSLEPYGVHPTITQDYLIIKQEENN